MKGKVTPQQMVAVDYKRKRKLLKLPGHKMRDNKQKHTGDVTGTFSKSLHTTDFLQSRFKNKSTITNTTKCKTGMNSHNSKEQTLGIHLIMVCLSGCLVSS